MKCPACGDENSKVIDSRTTDEGRSIRRRRECEECAFRFTTFERSQSANLLVEKRDGTAEPYDREKLEKGILIACGKRPVSVAAMREQLSQLEEKWGKEQIVRADRIGEDVIEMLLHIDHVAFIRFASVYREISDVDTFKKEFKNWIAGRNSPGEKS